MVQEREGRVDSGVHVWHGQQEWQENVNMAAVDTIETCKYDSSSGIVKWCE